MQKFSLAVAMIEMFRQDGTTLVPGATGTAFFYKSGNGTFLITNWHNVTGLDSNTLKPMHSQNLLPNLLRIHYKRWADADKNAVQSDHIDIPLYHEDTPVWLEHSERNGIDVVAIPLTLGQFENFANKCINEIDQETGLDVSAGMDCFILGYPEELIGAAKTPIWKRGSIAAEPYQQAPYLIDAATRKGMSGSPIISRHTGIFGAKGKDLTGTEIFGTVEKFVAIYSGRVGDDALGFQLGTAWQANVLDDIFSKKTPGKHPLQ